MAVPSSAASGGGSSGASSTTEPAGRREVARGATRRRRGRRSPPHGSRRPAPPRAPGGPARPGVARPARSREDQDEPGRRVDRRQVPVEERLEVAHRGRHPGRLLDLEDELAGGRPVGARGDAIRIVRTPARMAAIASAAGLVGGPAGQEVRGRAPRSTSIARRAAPPIGGRREDRRDVADGVAPALVQLLGRRRRCRRAARAGGRSGAAGDERRPRAGGAGPLERRVRRRRAALVGDRR